MDELVLACNIPKENYIRKIYIDWLNEEIPFPYNKNFKIVKYDDLFDFFQEIVYLAVFYRIYNYTSGVIISEKSFNTYLELIGFYEYIMSNSKLWIQDSNNYPNIDLTFSTYSFLKDKNFKEDKNDTKKNKNNLNFIKKVIISIINKHISSSEKLVILYNTALEINDYHYLFRTCNSILGIGFHELLTTIISDRSNSKITNCPVCHNTFVKHGGKQIYCSKICKGKARKEIDYKYNHSQKGKDRTIKFKQKKTSQND